MRALLDTNVLIRHFTGDPPDQAARATTFLGAAGPRELMLLDVHVAECVYVLDGPYRRTREEVSTLVGSILGLAAIQVENEQSVTRALELYAGHRLDFADAYLVARAEQAGVPTVVGFDRFDAKLKRASAVRRVEP